MGLHQPSDAQHFARCCVSVNRLRNRKSNFQVSEWMMDSGAFTEISTHGDYRTPVDRYAREIDRWATCGNLVAAVAQDWMCEPFIVNRTGLTVEQHQRRTIERYDALMTLQPPAYIMPVLQGYRPDEYLTHLEQYGERLAPGAWVGVGSVCKRNAKPGAVASVLWAIHERRPDLRLHGFGVKLTALQSQDVLRLLWSADSMAWSYAARMAGRSANDWREARSFADRIEAFDRRPLQIPLWS